MRKGQKMRQVSKDAIKAARAKQVHPSMKARGYTFEMVMERKANGLQWCCGYCKDFIPPTQFKDPSSPKCRECVKNKRAEWRSKQSAERLQDEARKTREWRADNPSYDRRRHLLRKYGVDPKWYEKQLTLQNGKCALCPATSGRQNEECLLFVDHDHETGKPRGLLCSRCNVHLGIYEQLPLWHRMARRYLRIHKNKKGLNTGANFSAHLPKNVTLVAE